MGAAERTIVCADFVSAIWSTPVAQGLYASRRDDDRRFWTAWATPEARVVYRAVMDDFGTLVETARA